MSLIQIDHLVKDFGGVRAVDDLTFAIDAGRISGFLGPNGSGKTTTLLSLLGLVTPTSGTATIDGRSYASLADPLAEVGAMLAANAHPARTARDHLRVLAAEAGVPRARADELLGLVELGAAADRRAGGFSLGMRQRLGLAGALMGDPRILVLDEPANGLDPEGIRWLRDFLVALAGEGRTVLLSSHVLSEVAQTVDEVVVISRGRLVTHLPLSELMARRSGGRVRLRTPDYAALQAVLIDAGFKVASTGGELHVASTDQDAIARLAFASGHLLYEITTDAESLEEVFLTLTTEPQEVLA
ncbi:MAG TPA: ATP-binding cassette domain-containing protein [Solirubrobacteraceae bacterium]|jgi:ABC-2 type transport system ATP-binding protein